MRNLRVPDGNSASSGCRVLAEKVQHLLADKSANSCRRAWLEERLGCFPLSWLFSDPQLTSKPALLGILEGDPNFPASRARQSHVERAPPAFWPYFNAGTQGDFASFILSGIGRLANVLGYSGFIIVMDEMEKWHELNWYEQTRAGNLLGGLIWGATAEPGCRAEDDLPKSLNHSRRCGGYPFSTQQRSHVGIAIAMTPRGECDVDQSWFDYGPILMGDVPVLSERLLDQYCGSVAPFFAAAFGLVAPSKAEIGTIAREALRMWREYGDFSNRSGVQSVIAALDAWRANK